jgi:Protein of unknown function (DUF3800)
MADKEYIIFCDESDKKGKYYSNFYGGLIVGASQFERVTQRLNQKKRDLNLFHEVKWERVTEPYLAKYAEFIHVFFQEVINGNIKVRIMFRQNAQKPRGLTREQIDEPYYMLYYQFVKHAFGLKFIAPTEQGTRLRLYFDQFPDTGEKVERFKGFLLGLTKSVAFRNAKVVIAKEDIAEVRSQDHVLLQGLDVVLGAMPFRLNDKHKEKPAGKRRRGKRTRAKEALYKIILAEIKKVHPRFNIGVSTHAGDSPDARWQDPYLHWSFVPASAEFDPDLTKRNQGK